MNGMTRREQQVTDINEIIEILEKSKVVHVGMIDGDMPYVVPMNYGYTYENEDDFLFYLKKIINNPRWRAEASKKSKKIARSFAKEDFAKAAGMGNEQAMINLQIIEHYNNMGQER